MAKSDSELRQEIERVIKLRGIRSADRANLKRMLDQIRHDQLLSEQERQNLWAYLARYSTTPR
jgi:hypothetical protein